MTEDFLRKIFEAVQKDATIQIEVNLERQTIKLLDSSEETAEVFEINLYKKTCLLNGYDDIDFLLSMKPEIEQFEEQL